jgi:hypothetical protein
MYRLPRPRSTAACDTGITNGSSAAPPFALFASGGVEELGDLNQSQGRRSPEDVLSGEEFHGHDDVPIGQSFVVVHCSWGNIYMFLYCVDPMDDVVRFNLFVHLFINQ